MKNAGNYAKSLVPLLITALYGIQSALSDGKVTNTEWMGIATGLLATVGAYLVPNTAKVAPAAPSAPAPVPTVNPSAANQPAPAVVTPAAPAVDPVPVAPLIPPDTTS